MPDDVEAERTAAMNQEMKLINDSWRFGSLIFISSNSFTRIVVFAPFIRFLKR